MPVRRGIEAEDAAAEFLQRLGYTIVTRRYKRPGGEADIVALDGDVLVFVEVKERFAPGWSPEEGVDMRKIESLARVAEIYLREMEEQDRTVRFDVVAIDRAGLRHHIDAFRP